MTNAQERALGDAIVDAAMKAREMSVPDLLDSANIHRGLMIEYASRDGDMARTHCNIAAAYERRANRLRANAI